MFYENELRLLRDVFKKLHIRTTLSSPASPLTEIIPECFELLGNRALSRVSVNEFFGAPEGNIIYKYTHAQRL